MALLEGKTALVTGGASGIGRAIVERIVQEGGNAAIADIDDEKANDLQRALGNRTIALRVDVTDAAAVADAVRRTVDAFGALDIMVNNAAIMLVSPAIDITPEQWRRVIDVNLTGVFLGAQAAARQMIAQGRGGVIINASSGAGRRGSAYFSAYCASKAGIISLTQSLAIELAPHKIRVNCYTPGHIMTPFWDTIAEGYARVTNSTREEVIERFRKSVPWGRFGRPEEVASAVVWLASDEAEYVSGQAIAMNGAELPW
ncbi:MAG: glucose 1-dehydrogenase [Chloroflexota bacterium]|nr:glucose 1-dehydrogenase [Dehalococcoidia bacterium]MDW8253271.1 glucose 1-dehydrogenase [Chloroflexota bacterium]